MRVDCPECGSVLHLQPDLAGKNLACPVCREVFAVPSSVAEDAPSAADLKPAEQFDPPIQLRAEEAPQIIRWSETVAPQSVESEPTESLAVSIGEVYGLKRQKRGRRKLILAGLILFSVTAITIGGVWYAGQMALAPDRLMERGRAAYDEQRFDLAKQSFEKLSLDYPDSSHAAEAKFLGRVAAWRALVASPINRANPKPTLESWKRLDEMLAEPEMKPFVAPDRFAKDVWDGIQKLQEDIVAHAKDGITPEDTSEAERWLGVGEELTPALTKYRPKGLKPGEGVADTTSIRAEIAKTRARIDALAEAKAVLAIDEAPALAQAREIFLRSGLSDDPSARTLLAEAEQRLRGRTRYVAKTPSVPARRTDVARLVGVLPTRLLTPNAKPDGRLGFFQIGGLLTAFDAGDGSVIWTDQIDPDDGETPESLAASDRNAEAVAYLAWRDASPALCVREKTGGLIWEQPLGAMRARGRPLIVRDSLMLAVFDPSRPSLGLINRYDLYSGDWLGTIEFGRPLANTGATRPGSTLWAVPAESDELLVLRIATPDGDPIDPILANGLTTGHVRGSIASPPILGGGDGSDPAFAVLPDSRWPRIDQSCSREPNRCYDFGSAVLVDWLAIGSDRLRWRDGDRGD